MTTKTVHQSWVLFTAVFAICCGLLFGHSVGYDQGRRDGVYAGQRDTWLQCNNLMKSVGDKIDQLDKLIESK